MAIEYFTNTSENLDQQGAGSENRIIYLMGGSDTLFSSAGNDVIYGNEDNDIIDGTAGDDTIYGGQGNDTIGQFYANIMQGSDLIYGNRGDDFLSARFSDSVTVYGGLGADTIQVSYDGQLDPVATHFLYGNRGDDVLIGCLSGVGGIPEIPGAILDGGQGDDLLYSNALFADTLIGGDGADHFIFSNVSGAAAVIEDFSLADGDRISLRPGTIYNVTTTTSGVLLSGIRPAEYPESYASGSILLSGVSGFDPAMIEFTSPAWP